MSKWKTVEVRISAGEEVRTGEEEDVEILSKVNFAKRPIMPIKNKHTKEDHY
jgi:hypothetical protein